MPTPSPAAAASAILGPPPKRPPLTAPQLPDSSTGECAGCGGWAEVTRHLSDAIMQGHQEQLANREEFQQFRSAIVILDMRLDTVAGMVKDLHDDLRRVLNRSIPDLVETTGEHAAQVARGAVAELRAEMGERKADSMAGQLRRADDRRWDVIKLLLTALIAAVVSFVAGRLTK